MSSTRKESRKTYFPEVKNDLPRLLFESVVQHL